jgi:hypothetical protein
MFWPSEESLNGLLSWSALVISGSPKSIGCAQSAVLHRHINAKRRDVIFFMNVFVF